MEEKTELKKPVSGIMLMLLISMLTLVFKVQQVSAYDWKETVYIRADGSIYPQDAPISTEDNVTYTLTDDIVVGKVPLGQRAIVIERDNIVLDGNNHTLQGEGNGTGIYLYKRTNVTVKNMVIKNFTLGICLDSSSNNRIVGNIFIDDGLVVMSFDNFVKDNKVNGKPLVYLEGVSNIRVEDAGQVILVRCNNIIVENLDLSHTSVGVELFHTNNSVISGNKITNNEFGIALTYSSNNRIARNDIRENMAGIALEYSDENSIAENSITINGRGIALYKASYNRINWNNITNNVYAIISRIQNHNNRFYHNNFVNNVQQVYSEESEDTWDNGYPSGGNYWSNYKGEDLHKGLDQDEGESDGIGDKPYVIDVKNVDHYPLMKPYVNKPPVASFSYSQSEPTIPNDFSFTDESYDPNGSIVSWLWDFGDWTFSIERSPTHRYSKKGNYTVMLTVIDDDGVKSTITKLVTIPNIAPTASFTYSPSELTVGVDVRFKDESTDPEGKLKSWLWDFGDGTTSNERNPTHRYQKEGTYTVKLTVEDDEGSTNNIAKTITIKPFYSQLWFPIVVIIIIAIAGIMVAKAKQKK